MWEGGRAVCGNPESQFDDKMVLLIMILDSMY